MNSIKAEALALVQLAAKRGVTCVVAFREGPDKSVVDACGDLDGLFLAQTNAIRHIASKLPPSDRVPYLQAIGDTALGFAKIPGELE